jgi:hypothetical protein
MMGWMLKNGVEPDDLGLLPSFLDDADPRPAREQLDANYPWGGYWRTQPASIDAKHRLCYPGDPPQDWLAMTMLRGESILVYPGSFVVILQPDRSFVFQRMD